MKPYSVGALSFVAGLVIGLLLLAPAASRVVTLTARVDELQKRIVENELAVPKVRAKMEAAEANVVRGYMDRIRTLEAQIDGLGQENSECASRCPYFIRETPHA